MAKRKSSSQRMVENAVKKTHGLTIFFCVLFLIIGAVGGWFGYTIISKNDTFEVVGEKEITLTIGQTYTEQGCKAVVFGKDLSEQIKIESDIDTTKEGTYFVVYTVDNFKYKNIQKVRVINVVAPTEG